MPNRILREGILSSERVELLNWAEEVFYRRLMSVVDDFGRYYARPALILAACYPLLLKKVSDSDIEKWLSACETAALVRVYPAPDGKRYLQLLDFKQQVRAVESRFPPPPDGCAAPATQTHSEGEAPAHLDVSVSVFGDVVEDVCDTRDERAKPSGKKKTRMPKDFGVSESVRVWAKTKGFGLLDEHLDAFRRKAAAKGYTYVDWDLAFMEAIREDWAKLRGRTANGAAPGPDVIAPKEDSALAKIRADDKKAVPPPPGFFKPRPKHVAAA